MIKTTFVSGLVVSVGKEVYMSISYPLSGHHITSLIADLGARQNPIFDHRIKE